MVARRRSRSTFAVEDSPALLIYNVANIEYVSLKVQIKFLDCGRVPLIHLHETIKSGLICEFQSVFLMCKGK